VAPGFAHGLAQRARCARLQFTGLSRAVRGRQVSYEELSEANRNPFLPSRTPASARCQRATEIAIRESRRLRAPLIPDADVRLDHREHSRFPRDPPAELTETPKVARITKALLQKLAIAVNEDMPPRVPRSALEIETAETI